MDPLPMPLFCPQTEVVIAGFPMGQVVRHHSPRSAGTNDVEDAIENASSRMFAGTSAQSRRALGKKRTNDFPFGIGQAARILTHPELLQYLTKQVQIKIGVRVIFQTASHEEAPLTANRVGTVVEPALPTLPGMQFHNDLKPLLLSTFLILAETCPTFEPTGRSVARQDLY